MARPTVTQRSEELYALLPQYQRDADPAHDYALLRYVSLLGDQVEVLRRVTADATYLADPDTAPYGWLPFLAMVAGVDYRVYPDTDGNRTALRQAIGNARGKRLPGSQSATVNAVKPLLTGGKLVRVHGIDPAGGKYVVSTYASQTPDPAAVARAARAQKPAGLALTVQTLAGQSYDDLRRSGKTYAQLSATGLTYAQLSMSMPDEGNI